MHLSGHPLQCIDRYTSIPIHNSGGSGLSITVALLVVAGLAPGNLCAFTRRSSDQS
jgi:hypothetical protein